MLVNDLLDPQLKIIFSFYERLHRKAPGSEATTQRAWSLFRHLPRCPRVVEFGCGSGASALVLAAAGADVTAVDIHQPFLDDLRRRAAEQGLAERLTPVCADMGEPPFAPHSFDLVWCEGAIYLVGFEEGLRRWRPLVKPGGCVAVSHVAWLVESPPRRAVEFWTCEATGIRSVSEDLLTLRGAGYQPLEHFVLPPQDWADYYDPLQELLVEFRRTHSADHAVQQFADSLQNEIDVWRECGDSFGYVFYLARVV